MKFVTYISPSTGSTAVGVVQDDQIVGDPASATLLELVQTSDLVIAGERILQAHNETIPLTEARMQAPIAAPPSFRDCMTFEGHVVNCNKWLDRPVPEVWYEQPTFYFSNPQAIIGPNDEVPIAPGSSMFDFELEIAAVVGRTGANLTPEQAEDHIAGYMVLCDWSARDVQMHEMTGSLGPVKGKDTVTSTGPYLVTPDELADRRRNLGYDLTARVSVNGSVIGEGNWADTYWSFADVIAYASRGTRVVPGDVIGGGTLPTCCLFEHLGLDTTSPRWLTPGDTVVLEVERLGRIETTVVTGPEVVPVPPRGSRLAAR
ncbi:fumarylacetoacetate hydrolase family protein [Rhodococcus opacus]|uniref:fumarylacetoacetate hydrolase family protein n=1 Tax=Rhodococcus opacus TaxID=37919 RepID=UPI001C447346|nr:fumarylacetoacetate hydrolase family protein [Rhodococcus opacus]MBV6762290.1 fumarylacetoacetate hydrolase family protein [Rhodococcus opacus]